ncbi:PGF-CTERM-anchored ABC transporter substrate-binding protein [Halorussus gelatinilyticus]|uniref:PGF-CTERM-anchored ABC transporter substrate-binding protein n=1 Tax=Halorussus gelatinilyticus TaxID=2937524 RepID=A0A8U0IET0_9EURY|nr:PGF-CTERM-anchored ABC transporter substrate-binding protein [Halorussus gelatinilyticus]UPV99417.1 PGF-CTERM-anchored ABC transporter substrate-binding protein [Halorussus gelatinilyticus]
MSQQATTLFAVLLVLTAGVAPVGAVSEATPSDASAVGSTAQSNCSFPVNATDATGTEVTVEQSPERVVTLGPSAAQTMWEIGGKSQVVGVTKYSSYLNGTESRANVSGAGRTYVNVEKVVAQEPGLVLAANVISNETVGKLREAGLTVFKFAEAKSVADIYAKTNLTGELTGNCAGAAETVSWMKDRISTVREATEGESSPSVFVSQGGGWTAGNGTFVGNVVELAGGSNVAAEANITGYAKISEEVIVEQNPEWIVQIGALGGYPQTEAYNGTAAVENGQIVTVSSENISQPAPRVVYAIVKMAKSFHPEAFADANATTTTATATTESTETANTETTTKTTTDAPATTSEGAMQEATTTSTAADDSSSGSIPGFGVPAALAALAGAAMLARRR